MALPSKPALKCCARHTFIVSNVHLAGGTSFLIREGEVEVCVHIPQQGLLPVSVAGSPSPETQSPRTPPAVSPSRPLKPSPERGTKGPSAANGTAGSPVRTPGALNGASAASIAGIAANNASATAAAYGVSGAGTGTAGGVNAPSMALPVNRRLYSGSGKEIPVSDDLLMSKIQESCSRARLVLSRRLLPGSDRCGVPPVEAG